MFKSIFCSSIIVRLSFDKIVSEFRKPPLDQIDRPLLGIILPIYRMCNCVNSYRKSFKVCIIMDMCSFIGFRQDEFYIQGLAYLSKMFLYQLALVKNNTIETRQHIFAR